MSPLWTFCPATRCSTASRSPSARTRHSARRVLRRDDQDMTAARSVPANGFPSPPEPGLTPQEVIARAERIAATLVDRQAETEQRGYYALDTHHEFLGAGLYRIMVPKRYGGYE